MTPEQQDFINTLNFMAAVMTTIGTAAIALLLVFITGRQKLHKALTDEAQQKAEEARKRTALADMEINQRTKAETTLTETNSNLASAISLITKTEAQTAENTTRLIERQEKGDTVMQEVAAAIKEMSSAIALLTTTTGGTINDMRTAQKAITDNSDARASELKATIQAAGTDLKAHLDARMDTMDEHFKDAVDQINKLPDVIRAMFAELEQVKARVAQQETELAILRPKAEKADALEAEKIGLKQRLDAQQLIIEDLRKPMIPEQKGETSV